MSEQPGRVPADPIADRAALERLLHAHRARLLPKRGSRLMALVALLLRALGLREFTTRYWTTLARTIYFPTSVRDPYAHPQVIAHELVHVRQWQRWGLWLWLSYVLLPLPAGLAWFRWRWEREAYLPELLATPVEARERAIERVCDSLWWGYAWPWPRAWMREWFRRATRAAERASARPLAD